MIGFRCITLDEKKKYKICSYRFVLIVVLLYQKKGMKQIGSVLNKFYRIQFWGIILAGKFDISDCFDGNKIK